MKRVFLAASLLLAAVVGYAENPTVSIIRVQQRYPWDGCVDIDYTVSGLEFYWTHYRLALSATSGGVTTLCSNFWSHAAGDLPTAEGTHRVTWNASKDAPSLNAKDVTFKFTMQYAPITEGMGEYMVIDISGGPDATTYPVRYIKSDNILPEAFNNRMYKTTKIVLKKIPAQTTFKINSKWVRFTKSYFMGLFEITQQQYKLVTNVNPSQHISGNTDTASLRPVDTMYHSLINANDGFLARLNARAKYHENAVTGFLLPTEAQWECACRAGTTTTYTFGTSAATLGNYAWYASNSSTTMPVGTRLPNPWGFYDMYGNVYELCDDYYFSPYPAGGTTEETAAEDPWIEYISGYKHKPMRGGSRRKDSSYCTSEYREGVPEASYYENFGGDHVGFRISKTLP